MKTTILFFTIMLFVSGLCIAQEEIVFTGIPVTKIYEGGTSRTLGELSSEEALEFKCTITKIDDKYLWTTRENTELIRIESGAFITFIAINGSGYVRIINPAFKEIVSLTHGETEKEFDYIEHLLLGLRTFSYYGTSQ